MSDSAIPSPDPHFPLHMNPAEIDLFGALLQSATYYLEWGSGGSTIAAVRSNVRGIVSVESDGKWIAKLQGHADISTAMVASRLFFRHVDLGPVGPWGVPTGVEKIRNWPRYAVEPFVSTDLNFDLILVDGRFRVHCLLAALNCAAEGTKIFLHDYAFRHAYTTIDKYCDTIERIGSAVVLTRRQKLNRRAMYVDLINSLFDA
jgi:hypothetical protein